MADEDLTRIENLKRKMYSRETEGMRSVREHKLHETPGEVQTDWGSAPIPRTLPSRTQAPFVRYFLIFSIAFFVVAAGYGAYLYFGGSNVVSTQNIGIEIAGPVSVRGGDPLSLNVVIENKNATPLQVADLLVEYPDGTRDPNDLSKDLPRYRVGLGDITPGAIVNKTVSAVLFGEEQSEKTIKVTVEYRVPGSNAIFYKESQYKVIISSAPLSIVVDAPKEANSGQDLTLQVTVNSNSSDLVRGVLLSASYPAGFSFTSADPAPISQNSVWRLGDVKPGSSRVFTIRGKLSGENLDTRVFRFDAGLESDKSPGTIGTPFATLSQEIAIKKPFVALSVAINGSNNDTVVTKSGKPVRVDITYTNNLLVPVSDLEVILSVKGSALDKTSVSVEKGFYQSADDTVLFNKTTNTKLSSIAPGQSGTLSLTLASRSLSQGIASLSNPAIQLSASVSGRRVEEGSVPQSVTASENRTVKIESDMGLNGRILYYSGPFKNNGPVPPKAEQQTTYTVVWTITNGSNDVSDAVVSASLPAYVKFVGAQGDTSVSYSDVGGAVTWNAGTIKSGTGFGLPPKEVSFQIAFTPSVSQVGQNPILINDMTLQGVDRFTNTTISMIRSALNTRLTSDPLSKQGDDIVIK